MRKYAIICLFQKHSINPFMKRRDGRMDDDREWERSTQVGAWKDVKDYTDFLYLAGFCQACSIPTSTTGP